MFRKIPPIVEETENPRRFRRVSKWAIFKREIFCPECGGSTTVGHFAWPDLVCPHCRELVARYDWLVPDAS